jgi:hypothetical protein
MKGWVDCPREKSLGVGGKKIHGKKVCGKKSV